MKLLKTFVIAVLASLPFLLQADPPYHPYRKVADKYYNVQPIYEWLKLFHVPNNKVTPQIQKKREQRPMSAWLAPEYSATSGVRYTVQQVLKDVVLLERTKVFYYANRRGSSTIALKNYPEKKSLIDGKEIEFIALKVGTYQYGGSTYAMYDYGTPYDPIALQKEVQATNSPAKPVEGEK